MKYGFLAALLLLAALFPGRAEAQTRNDVMTGVYRCAAIGNGRTWLDCYYGAAQVLRGRLGLPPAPQAQIALATAPPPSGPMPQEEARARDQVTADALRCNALAEERQWLDCYYAAAQPMRAQLKLSPAPQARIAALPNRMPSDAGTRLPPRMPDATEKVPADQFGLAAPPASPALQKKGAQVTSRIADYSFNRYGRFTVRLANGQVWEQLEGDQSFAKLKLPPEKYVATVKHGLFSSYNLTISGFPGLYRVHRTQ